MNPVAFIIFGISVRWYGIIMAFAMLIGVYLARWIGQKEGFHENDIIDVALWVLPLAVVGARFYYVLFNLDQYDSFLAMINIRRGGMAIHGGIIGGVIGGLIGSKLRHMNQLKLMDVYAPSLILGQAIGRWGNYINQEAHGGPTDLPWGILVNGVKVHPTFLYESIWDIGVFALLIYLASRKKFDGKITAIYLIGYSLGRIWIEGLRTDSLMLGDYRVAQLISMVMIVGGFILYQQAKKLPVRGAYLIDKKENQHGS